MQSGAGTVREYLNSLPADRKAKVSEIHRAIVAHLPEGFEQDMYHGMIGYVVPHKRYPAGYHVNPAEPLPLMALASQKNFIALYHMGMYADKKLLTWFTTEYATRSGSRLDMGKSCIRFKKPVDIPVDLVGELASKVTVDDWISLYESRLKAKARKS